MLGIIFDSVHQRIREKKPRLNPLHVLFLFAFEETLFPTEFFFQTFQKPAETAQHLSVLWERFTGFHADLWRHVVSFRLICLKCHLGSFQKKSKEVSY